MACALQKSRNSRIDDVLALWGIQDRLIVDKGKEWSVDDKNCTINYAMVNELIQNKRNRSLNYLKNALLNENK